MNTSTTISRGALIRESRRALALELGSGTQAISKKRWFDPYERVGRWITPWRRSRTRLWRSVAVTLGVILLTAILWQEGTDSDTPPPSVADEYFKLLQERASEVDAYASRYDISSDLAALILDIARSVGVDEEVAFRLIEVESGFYQHARSSVGALGFTQLMPETARWLYPGIDLRDEVFDPEINIRLGLEYLKMLMGQYDDDLRLALLAYNRGPGTVNRLLAQGVDPENGYAMAVLE